MIHSQAEINTLLPTVKVTGKAEIIGASAAVAQGDGAEFFRLRQCLFYNRPERSKSDAAGNKNQIISMQTIHGKRRAVGAANADDIPDPEVLHGSGQAAGVADGQGKAVAAVGVGGKGDRGLAQVRHGNHHKLAGLIGKTMAGKFIDQTEMIGVDQAVFPDYLPDDRLVGQVNVIQACLGLSAGIQTAGRVGFIFHLPAPW